MFERHVRYTGRGIVGVSGTATLPQSQSSSVRDRAEVFTRVQGSQKDHVNSNAELYGDNCIQDPRDPFFLPRYRVRSISARVSERTKVDEEISNLRVKTIWDAAAMVA